MVGIKITILRPSEPAEIRKHNNISRRQELNPNPEDENQLASKQY